MQWLMREFGRKEYKQIAYVNMESNPLMKNLFSADFDIPRILLGLQIETGVVFC